MPNLFQKFDGGAFNSRVRAYLSAIQHIPTSTFTKVKFNGISFDDNNEFDPVTNYRFTPKEDGYYLIIPRIEWPAGGFGTANETWVYKNGIGIEAALISYGSPTGYVSEILPTILHLLVNDYIEIYVWQSSGGTLDLIYGIGNTMLHIHRLS